MWVWQPELLVLRTITSLHRFRNAKILTECRKAELLVKVDFWLTTTAPPLQLALLLVLCCVPCFPRILDWPFSISHNSFILPPLMAQKRALLSPRAFALSDHHLLVVVTWGLSPGHAPISQKIIILYSSECQILRCGCRG